MRCRPSSRTPRHRGLDQDILLVITGEFGRTPRINGGAGRDHWAPLSTLALAGGGLKMGQVVGESTAKAEVPKTTPITPQDLMATVFHVLGVPQDLHYNDQAGRPSDEQRRQTDRRIGVARLCFRTFPAEREERLGRALSGPMFTWQSSLHSGRYRRRFSPYRAAECRAGWRCRP